MFNGFQHDFRSIEINFSWKTSFVQASLGCVRQKPRGCLCRSALKEAETLYWISGLSQDWNLTHVVTVWTYSLKLKLLLSFVLDHVSRCFAKCDTILKLDLLWNTRGALICVHWKWSRPVAGCESGADGCPVPNKQCFISANRCSHFLDCFLINISLLLISTVMRVPSTDIDILISWHCVASQPT